MLAILADTAQAKSAKTEDNTDDAIALLTKDHRQFEALFEKFENAKDDDAEKLNIVSQICEALSIHAAIEEEIFYPAAHGALSKEGEELLDEAEVEHDSIESLIAQLEDAETSEDLYDAKVKVLAEYVKHHVKEEENELFPKVEKTDLDLDQLGAEMAQRKAELMAYGDDEKHEEEKTTPEEIEKHAM